MRGVEDGGVVRIGAVLLEIRVLTGGEGLGFEPMTLGSISQNRAGLGNLENLSASWVIW